MREHSKAVLLLTGTALLWSSGGLAIKLVDLHPMALTGVRSALAALTIGLFLRLSGQWRGGLPRLSRSALLGAVAYAGMLITNVAATKLTTSANAILLAYTAPVYVALLAPLWLGEPTRRRDWYFVAVCLGGMCLFFLDRLSMSGLWGNVTAVGTGLCYAVFTMAMRSQRDVSPLFCALLGHVLTALVGVPFLSGGLPDASGWIGLCYLGLLQQGFSLVLYSWAIRRLGALEAILLMTLEPILNPVWVALGYGELPGKWAMVGGAVVILAVTLRGLAGAGPRSQRASRA